MRGRLPHDSVVPRLARMDETPKPAGPRNVRAIVVLVALLVVAVGVASVFRAGPRRPAVREAPAAVEGGEPGENDVQRALRLAGIDSTKKDEWVEAVEGASDSRLTPARREVYVRFANAERCTCGCGFTLAACRRFDSTCEVSGPRIGRLLDSIVTGRPRSVAGLRERPTDTGR